MSPANQIIEDSFEKARTAFFGNATATPPQNESPAERPKTQKDTSPEEARPKAQASTNDGWPTVPPNHAKVELGVPHPSRSLERVEAYEFLLRFSSPGTSN